MRAGGLTAGLLAVLAAGLVAVGHARAGEGAPEARHWRLETEHGAVHVWAPPGYEPDGAGTVVYVHGHGVTADGAWREHGLAEQFAASGVNALFVVPEAPGRPGERLRWGDAAGLLDAAARETGLATPPGPLILVGHSGAYRTIAAWLDERRVEHVILLDAFYGETESFAAWASDVAHRMTIVGHITHARASAFAGRFPDASNVDKVPASLAAMGQEEREARILYLHSQYDHFEIVTGGRVLPLVLGRAGRARQ